MPEQQQKKEFILSDFLFLFLHTLHSPLSFDFSRSFHVLFLDPASNSNQMFESWCERHFFRSGYNLINLIQFHLNKRWTNAKSKIVYEHYRSPFLTLEKCVLLFFFAIFMIVGRHNLLWHISTLFLEILVISFAASSALFIYIACSLRERSNEMENNNNKKIMKRARFSHIPKLFHSVGWH